MALRENQYRLVDQLEDSELDKARRLLELLKRQADDDPISAEELKEIQRGAQQVERGEFVTLDKLEQELER